MATLFPTLGNVDFENPYLAGKYGGFDFETPYVDFSDIKTEDDKKSGLSEDEYRKEKLKLMQDSIDLRNKLLSPEYQDREIERLDDLQAKQMARAQKYGKESAFYGFMYQGLPKLMAQAAFSRYAFAPEMVKGVQDAYSRMTLAGAMKPQGGQSYMSVNPMGGIG
jgi:hypothetical protein